jgi:hypothetical protein
MQDTTPAASQPRPEPITGRGALDGDRADVTWYEYVDGPVVDTPVIALIPVPPESDQDSP